MPQGRNTRRRVDLDRYAASCFTPTLFNSPVRRLLGCGATALALLSGIPPEEIVSKSRRRHFSDRFMVWYLRRHGFRTLELTLGNRASAKTQIGDSHVLLLSQWFRHEEGTWLVLHNGWCYHNFDIYSLEALSFVRKPLLSAHLVIHPRWRTPERPPAATTSKRVRKSKLLTLSKLDFRHQIIPPLP